MDTYRGQWLDRGSIEDAADPDPFDLDEPAPQVPVSPVGQDERRMQVRAYNHWASLLENRNFPSIEDLEPENLPDFGPHSVLLDFTSGIDNPGIAYLGAELARECGTDEGIDTLDDVPSRSLLSRITDHYMQILANQAPIGFEAEFVNQRDRTILYRGILLPFSTDDDTIDFIYGVINWKEMADARTTDELLLEVDQALDPLTEPRDEAAAVVSQPDDDVLELGAWSEDAADPAWHGDDENPLAMDELAAGGAIAADADFGAVALPGVNAVAFPEPAFGARALGLDEPANEDNPPPLLATKPTMPTSRVLPGYQPEHEDWSEDDEDESDGAADFGSLIDAHDAAEEPEFDEDEDEDENEQVNGYDPDAIAADAVLPAAEDEPEDKAAEQIAIANDIGGRPTFAGLATLSEPVRPLFGAFAGEEEDEDEGDDDAPSPFASLLGTRRAAPRENPDIEGALGSEGDAQPPVLAEPVSFDVEAHPADGLADTLAVARELAHQAIHAEDRTRSTLYAAISRAYDVSLAAAEAPREFAALIADAGLTVQDRAPMTPVVKLVFGAEYDKTRLAEYAAALSHAQRLQVERGELAGMLASVPGGLKQVVAAERRLRREEAGLGEARDTPREALARKLRQLDYTALDSVSPEGSEFTLLVARRLPTGEVVLLGEVAEDVPLLEKAARKLIG